MAGLVVVATVVLAVSAPILVVLGLLALANWRDRRRARRIARQILLTDAISRELGAIVAPVVTKSLGTPWRVVMRVPVDRPAVVSRIVAIAHDVLTQAGAGRYELLLTPERNPARPIATSTGHGARAARRLPESRLAPGSRLGRRRRRRPIARSTSRRLRAALGGVPQSGTGWTNVSS